MSPVIFSRIQIWDWHCVPIAYACILVCRGETICGISGCQKIFPGISSLSTTCRQTRSPKSCIASDFSLALQTESTELQFQSNLNQRKKRIISAQTINRTSVIFSNNLKK